MAAGCLPQNAPTASTAAGRDGADQGRRQRPRGRETFPGVADVGELMARDLPVPSLFRQSVKRHRN
jgi:hypothetical protein